MTAAEVIEELRPSGRESYKKTLLRHGIKEPCFGVKISELQKIRKRAGKDYQLALDLYETGIYDAMYLAGLIADHARMTRRDLERWLAGANSEALLSYTVPSAAAGSSHGWALALEWIESADDRAVTAGWTTLSALVSIKPDADLELTRLEQLLTRVSEIIHTQSDSVCYAMNGYVIALGTYVASLTVEALAAAERIGVVQVDMGDTSCKVPFAPDYLRKAQSRGAIGKKRRTL